MRRELIMGGVIALALTYGACTVAPSSPAPESQAPAVVAPVENVEAVISQLERDWVKAIVEKDVATLDRLLAEEFNGTSPTAHTYAKGMAIEDVKDGNFAVQSMNLDEISVNTYGDVAVAFTSQEEKSSYKGKDMSGHYHYTDVWVKKDGNWQAVASHGTRYDTGHSVD